MKVNAEVRDWLPDDEIAFIKPGTTLEVENKMTGKITEYVITAPKILKMVNVSHEKDIPRGLVSRITALYKRLSRKLTKDDI